MRNAAGIGDKWASQAMRGDPTPFPGHMSIPTPSDTTSSAALPTGSTGDVFDPSTVAHPQVQATEWFAGRHGGEFLHVHWWDDRRWAEDVGDIRVRRALRDTLAERLSAAVGGGDEYKRLIEVVTGCQTKNGMTSVLWHASFDEAFSADVAELDADPYLLNVANGTLDLRTLELREHNPKDRMTKITSGAYRHGLTSTEWEKFTARVLPDDGARGYLQRYLGLSLCGQALEHVFTIAIGTGANGKGTLRTAVAAALGDYHHEAPASLFLESKRNSGEANADLIALRGRRFVVASETDEGVRLSVSLMKQISGGDPITARRPYATASVTFPSSWTVLLVTNHLPKVPADDEAVWRRMRVVPFDEVIPEDERDGTLSEKLVAEVDAVITWLVDGWRDYRSRMTTGNPQGRLDEPRAVQQRTTLYRADSDNVARFVADECIADPTAVTSSDALWDRWVSWSMGQRIPRVDRSVFGQRLIALGFESKRSAKSRGYAGLELRHHPQE